MLSLLASQQWRGDSKWGERETKTPTVTGTIGKSHAWQLNSAAANSEQIQNTNWMTSKRKYVNFILYECMELVAIRGYDTRHRCRCGTSSDLWRWHNVVAFQQPLSRRMMPSEAAGGAHRTARWRLLRVISSGHHLPHSLQHWSDSAGYGSLFTTFTVKVTLQIHSIFMKC